MRLPGGRTDPKWLRSGLSDRLDLDAEWMPISPANRLMRAGMNVTEWIDDLHAADFTTVLEILAEKAATATLDCRAYNKRIPPRQGIVLLKVDGGIHKLTTGLDMPERLDQRTIDRGCLLGAERNRSFAEHDVEPFLHYLIAHTAITGLVGACDPFLRHGLFARLGGVDRIDQQVRVQKKLTAHCARHA